MTEQGVQRLAIMGLVIAMVLLSAGMVLDILVLAGFVFAGAQVNHVTTDVVSVASTSVVLLAVVSVLASFLKQG